MEIYDRLPFFPGFYETSYENSDTAYWAIKQELEYYQDDLNRPDLTEDDLDFDYKRFEQDVAENFTLAWENLAPKDVVTNVEFSSIDSPRYYNFRNDDLIAKITLADGWEDAMKKFMKENADWLRERIKDDWTSYDGFMSFMSNNFDDQRYDDADADWVRDKSWYWHLFSGEDTDRQELYITTMIGYMMYKEYGDAIHDELFMATMEDVYDGNYVYLVSEREQA